MIKTKLTRDDALRVLELGKMLHKESQYRDSPFDSERVWSVLEATLQHPDKYFMAFDDEYRGLLLLQMSYNFFSGEKWAGDLSFFVAPEARKHGLSTLLLIEGEKWAKENGATELTILHNAGINLDGADQYYEKQGFKLSGKIYSKSITE